VCGVAYGRRRDHLRLGLGLGSARDAERGPGYGIVHSPVPGGPRDAGPMGRRSVDLLPARRVGRDGQDAGCYSPLPTKQVQMGYTERGRQR
jgi:hypothetical protein